MRFMTIVLMASAATAAFALPIRDSGDSSMDVSNGNYPNYPQYSPDLNYSDTRLSDLDSDSRSAGNDNDVSISISGNQRSPQLEDDDSNNSSGSSNRRFSSAQDEDDENFASADNEDSNYDDSDDYENMNGYDDDDEELFQRDIGSTLVDVGRGFKNVFKSPASKINIQIPTALDSVTTTLGKNTEELAALARKSQLDLAIKKGQYDAIKGTSANNAVLKKVSDEYTAAKANYKNINKNYQKSALNYVKSNPEAAAKATKLSETATTAPKSAQEELEQIGTLAHNAKLNVLTKQNKLNVLKSQHANSDEIATAKSELAAAKKQSKAYEASYSEKVAEYSKADTDAAKSLAGDVSSQRIQAYTKLVDDAKSNKAAIETSMENAQKSIDEDAVRKLDLEGKLQAATKDADKATIEKSIQDLEEKITKNKQLIADQTDELKTADKRIATAEKSLSKVSPTTKASDEASDAAKASDETSDAAKASDETADAAKASDETADANKGTDSPQTNNGAEGTTKEGDEVTEGTEEATKNQWSKKKIAAVAGLGTAAAVGGGAVGGSIA